MNIGIDMDDTIVNTFDHLIPYLSKFLNVDVDYLKENNISYCSLTPDMQTKWDKFAEEYADEFIMGIPPKPLVSEYIGKLKEMGHSIVIITARDGIFSDPKGITMSELDKNHIYYDKVICAHDKDKVCNEENIDLFIDDSIENCEMVSAQGIDTLLFTSKGNFTTQAPFKRVSSWEEVYNYVTEKRG